MGGKCSGVGEVQVGSKLYVCGVNEPLISELCVVGSSNQQIRYGISFISANGVNKSVSQFVRPSVCCCYIEVIMLNVVEDTEILRQYRTLLRIQEGSLLLKPLNVNDLDCI
jgi:hypothetical protein